MAYPPQQPYRTPVVPGAMPPNADWRPPQKPPRNRLLPVLLGVLGVVVLGTTAAVVALAMGLGSSDNGPVAVGDDQAVTLAAAARQCNNLGEPGVVLADGEKTLIIDMRGEEDLTGASVSTLKCVLDQLAVPASVREHMDTTRALDGRQTDSWSSFEAAWTYHPDDGMALTIQQR